MISVALSHRDTRRDHENLGNIHQVPKKFRPIPTTWNLDGNLYIGFPSICTEHFC